MPDRCDWNVPDHIKEPQLIPPDRLKRKGRKKNKGNPSVGERRKRTQNIRRPRQNFGFSWLLFGMRSSNPSESNYIFLFAFYCCCVVLAFGMLLLKTLVKLSISFVA